MNVTRLALLLLTGVLAGCGGSKKEVTFWVKCHDNLVLSGAKSVDVTIDPTQGPVLSYPDPANPGKTGTIQITKDNDCTISPTGMIDN
jgi:hypothetical protein